MSQHKNILPSNHQARFKNNEKKIKFYICSVLLYIINVKTNNKYQKVNRGHEIFNILQYVFFIVIKAFAFSLSLIIFICDN